MSTVIPGSAGPVASANLGSMSAPPAAAEVQVRAQPTAKPVAVQQPEPTQIPAPSAPASRAAAEQPREVSRPISESTTPALSTYQDQSSGRLVVKVFDRTSGQILAEFPPERSLQFYPRQDFPGVTAAPSVEVEA